MKILSFILLLLIGMNSTSLIAQENSGASSDTTKKTLYLVKKNNNSELYGYILSDDGREILLETKTIGKVYIIKSDIKEIIAVANDGGETTEYKEHRETGPFTTRYYFTTNALPIKKNENYAMLHLYGPEVHFALSDNFSLGVMATWIASPIALAAKYSFNSKGKTHLALGTIMGSSGYILNGKGYGGLHWATVTYGDRKANLSFSAGYGYVDIGTTRNIGLKYSFTTDPTQQYHLPNYEVYSAVESQVYANTNDWEFTEQKLQKAIVIGISGISPVGQKASFIFDSMLFFSQQNKVTYSDHDVTVTYPDNQNGTSITDTFTIGKGTVVKADNITTSILLMPGMRFNKSYDKSFQIALAGIVNINYAGDLTTFPVPMVSWLRRF